MKTLINCPDRNDLSLVEEIDKAEQSKSSSSHTACICPCENRETITWPNLVTLSFVISGDRFWSRHSVSLRELSRTTRNLKIFWQIRLKGILLRNYKIQVSPSHCRIIGLRYKKASKYCFVFFFFSSIMKPGYVATLLYCRIYPLSYTFKYQTQAIYFVPGSHFYFIVLKEAVESWWAWNYNVCWLTL